MIKSGDVIKHKNFTDVAIQVMFVSVHPNTNDIEISGVWINQGQTQTYSINEPAKLQIKEKHLSDWLKCSKPKSTFIRNEEWKELE
jgi:hypothetical protein